MAKTSCGLSSEATELPGVRDAQLFTQFTPRGAGQVAVLGFRHAAGEGELAGMVGRAEAALHEHEALRAILLAGVASLSVNGGPSNGGGKNAKHANQDARSSAKSKHEDAKSRYENLKSKSNKTPEDKRALDQAKREMDHLKRKADFSGENHSQKPKN